MVGIEDTFGKGWITFFGTDLKLEPNPKVEETNMRNSHRLKCMARKLIGRNGSTLKPLEPEMNDDEIQQDLKGLKEFPLLWSQYPGPHICITRDGRLLLSHEQIRHADSVADLFGCPKPLILTTLAMG